MTDESQPQQSLLETIQEGLDQLASSVKNLESDIAILMLDDLVHWAFHLGRALEEGMIRCKLPDKVKYFKQWNVRIAYVNEKVYSPHAKLTFFADSDVKLMQEIIAERDQSDDFDSRFICFQVIAYSPFMEQQMARLIEKLSKATFSDELYEKRYRAIAQFYA